MQMWNLLERLKEEVLTEMQIWNWKETATWLTPQAQPEKHQTSYVNFSNNKLLQKQISITSMVTFWITITLFMALFFEVVETKIDDPRGRLTRLIKNTMREPKELIKHCIQLPHYHGYQTAVSLLENTRYYHHIEGS